MGEEKILIVGQEIFNKVFGNKNWQEIKLKVCLLGFCEFKLKLENLSSWKNF